MRGLREEYRGSRTPQKNHKATKRAFNVEPSSARQQNVISMYLDNLSPHQHLLILGFIILLRTFNIIKMENKCPVIIVGISFNMSVRTVRNNCV